MFPVLMNDDEFKENFDTYYDQFLAGFPDTTLTNESMGILCDNAYRRIKDETCMAHIKSNIDKAGNMMRVAQAQIDSGAFTPTSVLAGEFTIFANTGPAPIKKASTVVELSDFVGQYEFDKRTFSSEEQSLIPKLPEWYVVCLLYTSRCV